MANQTEDSTKTYPYSVPDPGTGASRLVWGCCESSIGPVCEHIRGTAHEPVIVLAGGDSVYVYDAFDPNVDIMYTVLIGANLDVVRRTVTAGRWSEVRPTLVAQGLAIIDMRAAREDAS